MKILRSNDFADWLSALSARSQALVEDRILRIAQYDHFGDTKHLDDGLCELRWKNGLRVYYARTGARITLLLFGGGKNDQKNDIKKAQILLQRYTDSQD